MFKPGLALVREKPTHSESEVDVVWGDLLPPENFVGVELNVNPGDV